MEATKLTKSAVKKGLNDYFNEVYASPFKVLSMIRNGKKDARISNVLTYYGVNNITLDMLLTYDNDTDRPVFCELVKIKDIEYLTGYELGVIKIGGSYFEYVPISFSINNFVKSLDSMQKIQKEEARKAKKAEKELEKEAKKEAKASERASKKEAKAASKKAKKEEQEAKKIAEKAKALASEYSDIPENILLQIAAKVLAA